MILLSVLIVSTINVALGQVVGQPCVIRGGTETGICKRATDCQFNRSGMRPTICDWDNNIPIICCAGSTPIPQVITTPPRQIEKSDTTLSISEQKCREYRKPEEDLEIISFVADAEPESANVTHCDQGDKPFIVGGTPAELGELPYMVALGYKRGNELEWNCGGTLISDRFVLTAAHCADTSELGPPVVVRLGELDFGRSNEGATPIDIEIEERLRYPSHRFKYVYDDIALIKMRKSVTFTKQIQPACLWTSDNIKGTTATASGWGKIGDGEDRSLQLLKVGLNIYNRSLCENNYSASRRMPEGLKDSMLCAGELKGGKDTCKGDSGGPLVITKDGNLCDYHIVGVVSFGKICGAKNMLGVYTKVSAYISWIEENVWK